MAARIVDPGEVGLALCVDRLVAGEPVAMPTETVYGLAADARSAAAVARVFAVKERPTFDPLIVHLAPFSAAAGADPVAHLADAGVVDAGRLDAAVRASVARLAGALWPGPLTLVLPRGPAIADLVTSGLPSVAVRLPRHPVAQALLERCGFPLAAPSANRFGRISPTSAADVLAELGSRIDLILDGGRCEVGVESTVVRVRLDGGLELLRPGGIGRAAIEAAAGQPLVAAGGERASPGLLASHYAPRTRLWLLPGAAERELEAAARRARLPSGAPLGVLLQRGDERERAEGLGRALGRPVTARVLSPGGQPAEAARRLFGCLRELDAAAVVALFAEPCPDEEGLMHAIADRLRRAAGLG